MRPTDCPLKTVNAPAANNRPSACAATAFTSALAPVPKFASVPMAPPPPTPIDPSRASPLRATRTPDFVKPANPPPTSRRSVPSVSRCTARLETKPSKPSPLVARKEASRVPLGASLARYRRPPPLPVKLVKSPARNRLPDASTATARTAPLRLVGGTKPVSSEPSVFKRATLLRGVPLMLLKSPAT